MLNRKYSFEFKSQLAILKEIIDLYGDRMLSRL